MMNHHDPFIDYDRIQNQFHNIKLLQDSSETLLALFTLLNDLITTADPRQPLALVIDARTVATSRFPSLPMLDSGLQPTTDSTPPLRVAFLVGEQPLEIVANMFSMMEERFAADDWRWAFVGREDEAVAWLQHQTSLAS